MYPGFGIVCSLLWAADATRFIDLVKVSLNVLRRQICKCAEKGELRCRNLCCLQTLANTWRTPEKCAPIEQLHAVPILRYSDEPYQLLTSPFKTSQIHSQHPSWVTTVFLRTLSFSDSHASTAFMDLQHIREMTCECRAQLYASLFMQKRTVLEHSLAAVISRHHILSDVCHTMEVRGFCNHALHCSSESWACCICWDILLPVRHAEVESAMTSDLAFTLSALNWEPWILIKWMKLSTNWPVEDWVAWDSIFKCMTYSIVNWANFFWGKTYMSITPTHWHKVNSP